MSGWRGANVGDQRSSRSDLPIVRSFDRRFPVRHHLIELLLQIIPLRGIEVVEGLVVVAVEGGGLLALELFQSAAVPEPQVISQLADRMLSFARSPVRLVRGESGNGDPLWDEPLCLIVGRVQLCKQNAAQRGGLLLVLR